MGKLVFVYLNKKKLILYQEVGSKRKKEVVKKEEREISQLPITTETWKEIVDKDTAVSLILSPSLLIFREISFPFGEERKIRKTIKYTIESSLPFSAEEFEVFYTKRKEKENFHLNIWIFSPLLLETIKNLEEVAVIRGVYSLPHIVYSYLTYKRRVSRNSLLWIRWKDRFFYLIIQNGKAGKAGEIPWKEKDFKLYLFSEIILENRSLSIYFWGEREKWFDEILSREEIHIQETFPEGISSILSYCRRSTNFYAFTSSSPSWKITLTLLALLLIVASSRLLVEEYWIEKKIRSIKKEMRDIYLSLFPNSRVIDPLMQLKSKLKEARKESNSRFLDILREISSKYSGKGVTIEKIVFTGEEISLEGTIPSYATLDNFLRDLNKSLIFENWEIVNAESKREGRVRFRIRSEVR